MIGNLSTAAGSCTTAIESAEYVSIKYTERLAEAGIEPSVGRVGDSYTTLSPRRSTVSTKRGHPRRGPWRSFEAVEFALLFINIFKPRCAGCDVPLVSPR